MAYAEENLRTVPFISFVHPGTEGAFKAVAADKKTIRENRSTIAVACAKCTKMGDNGVNLQKCSRCKAVAYCSRECQKAHWPAHKKVCKDSIFSLPKLLNNLIANPLLNHYLQLCFITEFGLDKEPIIDRPLLARVKVVIEPSDMGYTMRMVMGQLSAAERAKGEGMIQIRRFRPQMDSAAAIDHTRMELWKNSKKALAEQGFVNKPIGLVDFYSRYNLQTITFSVMIQDDSFDRVKSGVGFKFQSAMADVVSKAPLSRVNCLDALNLHIRNDKRNQLRLRTELNSNEINILEEAEDDTDTETSESAST